MQDHPPIPINCTHKREGRPACWACELGASEFEIIRNSKGVLIDGYMSDRMHISIVEVIAEMAPTHTAKEVANHLFSCLQGAKSCRLIEVD